MTRKGILFVFSVFAVLFFLNQRVETKSPQKQQQQVEKMKAEEKAAPFYQLLLKELKEATKLEADIISYEHIAEGSGIADFEAHTGAEYKPSFNEDPAIPVQCWIETGYGTQNACKYCHTNFLADKKHGNNFPIGEDQVLYSFPSPNLNKINWKNVTHPQDITKRLQKEGIKIPRPDDPENLSYVRSDNWNFVYEKARPNGGTTWNNLKQKDHEFQMFPSLNPQNLFPFRAENPTDNNQHGYIDQDGFIRNKNDEYTGWRAVNFFPYALFTPLAGSVSGIYIRLPKAFMQKDGKVRISVYEKNLDLLLRNIKMDNPPEQNYYGDAVNIPVKKGFYPVGTEFAHPLHYVDLNADGESGKNLNGLNNNKTPGYEFPGTRSKRVKEIRYMYKWKDVGLEDIDENEIEEKYPKVIGKEWQGWIDNKAGWILAAYIENREGNLRPQTTEELLQCLGCHSSVGNTIDAVWSFQRKLPGAAGWQEMSYGHYKKARADKTRLNDYKHENIDMGELEYFYYSVVGADLFGVMPDEIKTALKAYVKDNKLQKEIQLKTRPSLIFDDEKLKSTPRKKRIEILQERAKIMRHYAGSRSYLHYDADSGEHFIKGNIFYPTEKTMKANIAGYRRIVLDQSFNLGKNTFGTQPDTIPFTFRSDGTVKDGQNRIIPVGAVITSRPWGSDGIGITPTGLVKVNKNGEPVDAQGNVVDVEKEPQKALGHVSTGGTFDTLYTPVIKEKLRVTERK